MLYSQIDRWRSHLSLKKAHEGHPLAFLQLRRVPRPLAARVGARLGGFLPHGARDGPSTGHGTVLSRQGSDAITSECSGSDLASAAPWRPPAPISSHRGALRVASTLRLCAGLGWSFTFGVVGEARGGCSAPSRSVGAHGGCSQPYSFAPRGRARGELLAGAVNPLRAPSERAFRSAACRLVLGVPGRPCEGRGLAWGFAPRPRRGSAPGAFFSVDRTEPGARCPGQHALLQAAPKDPASCRRPFRS